MPMPPNIANFSYCISTSCQVLDLECIPKGMAQRFPKILTHNFLCVDCKSKLLITQFSKELYSLREKVSKTVVICYPPEITKLKYVNKTKTHCMSG